MNISKRRVQAICYQSELNITAATNHGDASELLIVKTNRNCGGKREARLTPEIRCLLGVQSEPFWDRADHGYLVMPRCQIPATVWSDPGLVVERYIENEEHLFYRVYFLGRRFAISEASEQALVKTIGRAERLRLLLFTRDLHNTTADSIPRDLQPAVQECLQFVAAASIEFGCLDMLRDAAGNFYVVDINSTPHWGRESEFRIIDYIRHGIATDLRSF